jgi:hypothetical protein
MPSETRIAAMLGIKEYPTLPAVGMYDGLLYGRSDYVCSGYYNGGSCSNAARFQIADIERSVVDALKINFLSDEYLASAADIAAAHFEQVQRAAAKPDLPEVARSLQQVAAREAEVRDQFKTGKLPNSVFRHGSRNSTANDDQSKRQRLASVLRWLNFLGRNSYVNSASQSLAGSRSSPVASMLQRRVRHSASCSATEELCCDQT